MECLIINVSDDEYMCAEDFSIKPEFGEHEFIKPEPVDSSFIEDASPQVKNEFIFGGFALPPSSSSVEDYVESSGNELEDEVVIISDDEDAPPDTSSTDGISSIVISNVETIAECPDAISPLGSNSVGETAESETTSSVSRITSSLHSVSGDDTSKYFSISNDASKIPEKLNLSKQETTPISRTTISLHSVSEEETSKNLASSNDASKEPQRLKPSKQDRVIFKCNICEFSAKTRFSLVRHQMRRSHGETRNEKKSTKKNDRNNGTSLIHSETSHVTQGKKMKDAVESRQNTKAGSLLVKKGDGSLQSQKKNTIKSLIKPRHYTKKHRSKIVEETSSSRKENSKQTVKPTQKNAKVQLLRKNVEETLSPQGRNNGENILKSTQDNEKRVLRFKNVDENNGDIQVKSSTTSRTLLSRKNIDDNKSSQVKNNNVDTSINKTNVSENPLIGSNRNIPKLKVFNCKLCSFSCKIRFALKRHMLTHARKPQIKGLSKFGCTYCSYHGNSKKALFTHALKAHKANNIKCKFCKKLVPECFKNEHKIRCQKYKTIVKCDNCHFKTTDRRKLVGHRKKCGQELMTAKSESACKEKTEADNLSAEKLFVCKFCSFSTSTERTLTLHLSLHTVHNRPILQCKICDYRSTKHNLWRHMKICRRDRLGSELRKVHGSRKHVFTCNVCSYTTKVLNGLKLHLRTHTVHKRPVHTCSQCDFKSTARVLLQHVKVAHKKKPSPKGPEKKLHTLKSDNKPQFSCNFCSYTSKFKRNLQEHLRTHTVHNRPLHSCSECDFKSTHRVLLRHIKIAHSQKSLLFHCNFCSFSTKSAKILRGHIKLHTVSKETIYQCNKCDYRSTRRNFTLHVKKNHALGGNIKSEPEMISFPSKTNQYSSEFKKTNLSRDLFDKKVSKPLSRVPPAEKDEPDSSNKIEIVQTVLNQNKGVSGDYLSSNLLFVCEICDYVTKWKEVLISHKSTHSDISEPHTREKKPVKKRENVKSEKTLQKSVIICRVCKRHLASKGALNIHVCAINTDQYTVQVNGRVVMYHCKKCSYKTYCKQHIVRHCDVVKHTSTKVLYKCSFCRFQANCKAKLNLHKRMRHSAILGEKQESDQWALTEHKSGYYGVGQETEKATEVMYKCDICDFQTIFEDSLHNHQILHININEVRVYKNKTYNVGNEVN